MTKYFIILFMIFMHIVDDFKLQGILASMKQRQWWEENAPNKLYKYDYIWALLTHSFSWSFMIMLPIAIVSHFNIGILFVMVLIANIIIHCIIDDLKANKHKINLIEDQIIHIVQIIVTFMCFCWGLI